jgi:hypothetical protein
MVSPEVALIWVKRRLDPVEHAIEPLVEDSKSGLGHRDYPQAIRLP